SSFNEKELPYYFSFKGLNLADGTYITETAGYSPGLKLEVTIADNSVKRIKILRHFEVDSKYYKEAMLVIPEAILKQQTLDVDGITGSSMTSLGIIKGVRKAVLEAVKQYNKEQTIN
ncbi:MAG: FMN-binding protein, partial [Dehalobacterium sp.]